MTTDGIELNPAILQGKPVIHGTRIPVEDILRKLGDGASESDLLHAYPRLTRDEVQAALRFAAERRALSAGYHYASQSLRALSSLAPPRRGRPSQTGLQHPAQEPRRDRADGTLGEDRERGEAGPGPVLAPSLQFTLHRSTVRPSSPQSTRSLWRCCRLQRRVEPHRHRHDRS